MNTAFVLGRFCLRRGAPNISRIFTRRPQCCRQWTNKHSFLGAWKRRVTTLPGTPRTILVIAALSPAAFVQISQEEVTDGQTAEAHMLEVSREEIRKKIPDDVHGLNRLFRCVIFFVDQYIYEPVATSLRFLYLVIIFVPVIVTIPVIWFGRRQKDRDNERAGTLWWYGFLVSAMESAGPAFIKVSRFYSLNKRISPNRRFLS
jgi:aarF domain-containing kinase